MTERVGDPPDAPAMLVRHHRHRNGAGLDRARSIHNSGWIPVTKNQATVQHNEHHRAVAPVEIRGGADRTALPLRASAQAVKMITSASQPARADRRAPPAIRARRPVTPTGPNRPHTDHTAHLSPRTTTAHARLSIWRGARPWVRDALAAREREICAS